MKLSRELRRKNAAKRFRIMPWNEWVGRLDDRHKKAGTVSASDEVAEAAYLDYRARKEVEARSLNLPGRVALP